MHPSDNALPAATTRQWPSAYLISAAMLVLSLGMFIASNLWGSYSITGMTHHNLCEAAPEPIESFPFSQASPYPYGEMPNDRIPIHQYQITLKANSATSAIWRIVPDDCVTAISINDAPVSLQTIPAMDLCNIQSGFLLDFKPFVQSGENNVTFLINDKWGGLSGLNMWPLSIDADKVIQTCSMFLLFGALWLPALWRHFSYPLIAIAQAGLFCCLWVFVRSSYTSYATDIMGHIEYIRFLQTHYSIPKPFDGWLFYNPPLYYMLAALADSLGALFSSEDFMGARLLSIVCVMVFQFYGLLLLKAVITQRAIQWLCGAVFVFWPLFRALIGRINCEIMLYPLWAAALYYLFAWYRYQRLNDLVKSLLLCAVMFLVKTSAIVPLLTVGAIVSHVIFFQHRLTFRYFLNRKILLCATLILAAIGCNFGRTLYYKILYQPALGLVVGNVFMDPNLYLIHTDNDWYKFLGFDFNALFTNPFFSWSADDTGRQYVWTSYFKTLLFGYGLGSMEWAIRLNILFFILAVFTAFCAWVVRSPEKIFFTLAIGITLLAHVMNRIITQTVITHDARFTFPILIVFLCLSGHCLQTLLASKQRILAYSEAALLSAFLAASIIFAAGFIL